MKVKICGITQLLDAYLALELGAWALGFVFYQASPRFITPQRAGEIIAQLPPETKTVGVFVNAPLEEIEEVIETTGISTIQLHGNESPELCEQLSKPVIKAFRLEKVEDIEQLDAFSQVVEAFLVDAAVKGTWGGTGQVANWELVTQIDTKIPLILAGGITSENIREAINRVQPFAVDLSSGVEQQPGIKDPRRLRALFEVLNLKEKIG